MGRMEESRIKRKDTEGNPLKDIGSKKRDTNKFDVDEKTIKKQQNKQ